MSVFAKLKFATSTRFNYISKRQSNFVISRGFYFRETPHPRSLAKINPRENIRFTVTIGKIAFCYAVRQHWLCRQQELCSSQHFADNIGFLDIILYVVAVEQLSVAVQITEVVQLKGHLSCGFLPTIPCM